MIQRSEKYAMIGGVCAGYAISEKKPVALVRLFAVLALILSAGVAIPIYIAAWIVMPKIPHTRAALEVLPKEDALVRTPNNQVIGGVCGALAKYFQIDATAVRAGAVIMLLMGVGFFVYIFAWLIIPERTA